MDAPSRTRTGRVKEGLSLLTLREVDGGLFSLESMILA